jgi:NAD(P)H dehydrogenase (quinone)
MYAITGITGQVGGAVARNLLAAGKPVRAVVRDAAKAAAWTRQGCELALATMTDAAALQQAFTGAEAVFVLMPSNFDPTPQFPEALAVIGALRTALEQARPARVVCISTVGAQATQENLLSQLGLMEQALGNLPMPVTFLRPAWFMENAAWDVAPARETGVIPSFLQPLARRIPMVATADVGRVAAELLMEAWNGKRVVELEGPRHVSPDDIAAGLGRLLGRQVEPNAVPRDTWEALFRSQGARNPQFRMRMIEGFNEGWITFEHTPRKGLIAVDTVLAALVERGD